MERPLESECESEPSECEEDEERLCQDRGEEDEPCPQEKEVNEEEAEDGDLDEVEASESFQDAVVQEQPATPSAEVSEVKETTLLEHA